MFLRILVSLPAIAILALGQTPAAPATQASAAEVAPRVGVIDFYGLSKVTEDRLRGALGFHAERVSEPAEVIPALRRALDVNKSGRPAYIEFICCQYPVYGQWVGRSTE